MNLAAKLREAREKNGLTQQQVAQKLQLARHTVANWEDGQHAPNNEQLKALAGIYQMTPDQFKVVPAKKRIRFSEVFLVIWLIAGPVLILAFGDYLPKGTLLLAMIIYFAIVLAVDKGYHWLQNR